MENQPQCACERTKSKQKRNQVTWHSNWPRVHLFDLARKHCNFIIKGWLHCLTSESKGRFLVNNVIFGSAWCVNPIFFNKKTKIGRPENVCDTRVKWVSPFVLKVSKSIYFGRKLRSNFFTVFCNTSNYFFALLGLDRERDRQTDRERDRETETERETERGRVNNCCVLIVV